MKNYRAFAPALAALIMSFTPALAALTAPTDYLSSSPHSSHVTMAITDYRQNQVSTDYDWTAAHYDWTLSGKIEEYRKRNPAMKYYVYALNLTTMQASSTDAPNSATVYYADMQSWYGSHTQYNLEDAFLHDATECPASQVKTAACRISIYWWSSNRWVINPGDPGLRAYDSDRLKRITTNVNGTGYNADGVFFDEHSSGDFAHYSSYSVREYPVWSKYPDDVVGLLASERAALGKIIQVNTAEYISATDQRMALAAGLAHMEFLNNPLNAGLEDRWKFVDTVLQKGAYGQLVNSNTWSEAAGISTLSAGNQASAMLRLKNAELCSYYMVVPSVSNHLGLYMGNNQWNTPYSQIWLQAAQMDIGHPTGARTLAYQGTDPNGQPAHIWKRDFDKAIVLMRPIASWNYTNYGDNTKVTYNLPAGETWLPLNADGSLAPAVTSVTLRSAEGIILFKASALTQLPSTGISGDSSATKPGKLPPGHSGRTLDGRYSGKKTGSLVF